ncbi:uncharacterized protein LOC141902443 [Tubulanus polymorphus]|uniref:uncharacterized protein LOC141902443 n=1 Tax=Tubulanus polymorphus TaxID=672921 RepID=UPI003DA6B8E3
MDENAELYKEIKYLADLIKNAKNSEGNVKRKPAASHQSGHEHKTTKPSKKKRISCFASSTSTGTNGKSPSRRFIRKPQSADLLLTRPVIKSSNHQKLNPPTSSCAIPSDHSLVSSYSKTAPRNNPCDRLVVIKKRNKLQRQDCRKLDYVRENNSPSAAELTHSQSSLGAVCMNAASSQAYSNTASKKVAGLETLGLASQYSTSTKQDYTPTPLDLCRPSQSVIAKNHAASKIEKYNYVPTPIARGSSRQVSVSRKNDTHTSTSLSNRQAASASTNYASSHAIWSSQKNSTQPRLSSSGISSFGDRKTNARAISLTKHKTDASADGRAKNIRLRNERCVKTRAVSPRVKIVKSKYSMKYVNADQKPKDRITTKKKAADKVSRYKLVRRQPESAKRRRASVAMLLIKTKYSIQRKPVSSLGSRELLHSLGSKSASRSVRGYVASRFILRKLNLAGKSDLEARKFQRTASNRKEKNTLNNQQSHMKKYVMINGYLYKSNSTKLVKQSAIQSPAKVKPLKPARKTNALVIKKMTTAKMKTVTVRGVKFRMDPAGKTLQRITTGENSHKSPTKGLAVDGSSSGGPKSGKLQDLAKRRKKISRVDIGGVTYIQTKPGTLVKASTTQNRLRASHAIQRSIAQTTAARYKKVKIKYCLFYNRFGKCNRGDKCPFKHDPTKVAICTRFLRGTCKVTDCPFSHTVSKGKMPVCSYFLRGVCNHDNCPYLHVKVNKGAKVCDDFIDGFCALGDECKKQHTLICPTFWKKGKCSSGAKCRMVHLQKRTRVPVSSGKTVADSSKTIASVHRGHTGDASTTEEETSAGKKRHLLTKQPSYISLNDSSSQLQQTSKLETASRSTSAVPLRIRPIFLDTP